MKRHMTSFLLLVILLCNLLQAQSFEPPKLDLPLRLPAAPSGTFAEIRTNHFHSGIDLRVGGDEGVGTPVYAPADGYVSRLRISAYDGGKMLYINHKGNITTVYLHLDGYHGAIADYVLAYQRAHQCYAFDTVVPEGALPVKRGQLIAYAGNSGMSGGPHLHYEVRNTRTQQSLNPSPSTTPSRPPSRASDSCLSTKTPVSTEPRPPTRSTSAASAALSARPTIRCPSLGVSMWASTPPTAPKAPP